MGLPLQGIRVLDLSMYLPGPLCSQFLADFGAEVIKVEELTGEWGRWVPPKMGKQSARFYAVNRNKKSIALNLKTEEGKDVFRKLVATADVLVEQFRPGVMDKLGLGYQQLRGINPRLIYCAITGYGQTGPLKMAAGHDLNYLSLAGVTGLTGTKNGRPAMSAVQIADIAGGTHGAVNAILLALLSREKSGEGQFCDVAMMDGAVNMLAYTLGEWSGAGQEPRRGAELLTGGYACYNIYETKDGKHVSLGAIEDKFWQGFCAKIGRLDFVPLQWVQDKQEEMINAIGEVFRDMTRDEWVEFFADTDICFTPVLSLEEMAKHPQVMEREMVIMIDDFLGTGKAMFVPGIPVKLSETPGQVRLDFPEVGKHTCELLEELGCTSEEISNLKNSGVVQF
ncbi:MAG: CoA transferase [Syntrophothermus sp.]|uniref:CaiB/BaiF CoA transferase family protein n=1 Tax=Syntrophothermus sp. TaxID=2736299 RepID=UPI00257C5BC2|nr:CaiB/BaiF CoA-transferase family protein [Syntrophothermus sp.]NSW83112.1 CoA transferase [Syntrophothermus sp.]